MKFQPFYKAFILFVLLFIAFYVRVYKLTDRELSWEEGLTVSYSALPARDILSDLFLWNYPNPPFYYSLNHEWMRFKKNVLRNLPIIKEKTRNIPLYNARLWWKEFGWTWNAYPDVISLRLFAVLMGLITCVLFYKIGKHLYGDFVGWSALLITGLSPFHLWYSRENGIYSAIPFFITLCIWYFIRGMETGKTKYWLRFAICGLIGVYMHTLVMFGIVTLNLWFYFYAKRNNKEDPNIKTAFFAQLAVWFGFIPWLINLFYRGKPPMEWVEPLGWSSISDTFLNWLLGIYIGVFPISLILVIPILIFLFLRALFIRQRKENPESGIYSLDSNHDSFWIPKNSWSFIWIIFLIPLLLLIGISFYIPIYVPETTTLVAYPGFVILLAYGIGTLKTLGWRLRVLGILIIAMLFPLTNYFMYHRDYHRESANIIKSQIQPGDIVLYLPYHSSMVFDYYFQNLDQRVYPKPWEKPYDFIGFASQNHPRVWVVEDYGHEKEIDKLNDFLPPLREKYQTEEIKKVFYQPPTMKIILYSNRKKPN